MLRILRAAIIALAVLASGVVGAKDREVAIGLQAAITSIDPHFHNLSPNNSLLLHIFEPLIKGDPKGMVVRGLGTSGGGVAALAGEYKLRGTLKFHDGSLFTADDVVFTLKRVPNVPNSP